MLSDILPEEEGLLRFVVDQQAFNLALAARLPKRAAPHVHITEKHELAYNYVVQALMDSDDDRAGDVDQVDVCPMVADGEITGELEILVRLRRS